MVLNDSRRGRSVAIALAGRVPVKVTDENDAILSGDLLVSASKLGFAMRCAQAQLCEGAILGKALDALNEKTGTIRMLVMNH